jgi:hypothetical protein
MKLKRVISIAVISLFTSLFQGVPAANAAGVPTWNATSWAPDRIQDPANDGGCQATLSVNDNGSPLTNYLVQISTSFPGTGDVRTWMPITPAQTDPTIVKLNKNFFASFGAVERTIYHFTFIPVNALGQGTDSGLNPASQGRGINCDISGLNSPETPGTPTVVAGDASATVTITPAATGTGNAPSSYTVIAYDNAGAPLSSAKTCTVTIPSTSCQITGLINGTPYKFKSSATNSKGTSAESVSFSTSATPTGPIAPTITNVTSLTGNGSYKAGQTVSIQVTFNQAVTVTGTPELTLETGLVAKANYTSGTGTNTLTFDYIIQAGDTSSDLTYVATNSLALSGGTIKNSATLDAVLTLPSPSAAGSLGANKAIVVDTTAPSTPSTPDLDLASDIGSSSTDNITSDNTPTISVSGVFSGTAVVTATKAGSTSVVCTITSNACTLAALAEGTWVISVTDTDAAGNATTSTGLSITVDTTAPTAGLTAGSIISSENAAVTSSAVGTAYLVNTSVAVNNLASITGAADASWNSVAITTANTSTSLAATGLTPGTYRLYTADAAGNLSAVSTNSVTVTLAAPGAPDLVAGSDLGSSSTDNTTNDDTPEISITGLTIGAVITLTATPSSGTAVVCTFTATATTGSCPFTTLANGTYSVAATQTFNSVTSNAATLTGLVINKTTIATPSTPDLDATSDSGSSATDNVTSDKTPKINVTGPFSGTAVVTATKTGSTSVFCTISSETCTLDELSDGTWSISVTVTDSAGNATISVALPITVDSTAPTPTVATTSVTTASGVTVRSSEVGTAYLVKTSVTGTDLASITGAADNSMNLVAINTAGTDTVMSTDGLLAGDYELYVVDAAGNLSLASTNTVTVAVAAAPTSTSTTAPTGTTTFGSTLTNAVTFAGVPTPTQLNYQWKSCASATDTTCTDIAGATSSSFIANAIELVGKFIRVLVTAINGIAPNGSALSSPTAAITAVAPGVPVVGTPTVGDLQINVPFTAPTSNGGSTITKYQFSTDGGVTWSDRTDSSTVTSPIAIKFLSTDGTTPIVAGTTYPIQIRAVNTATNPTGAATASVSVKALTTPGAPTAVTATATGQTTATVSFTAPANNGGSAITTYTVTSSPGGITASGSTSPISITGLSASTTYTFTVTANNGSLTSVASAASSAITTSSPPPAPVCDAACVAAEKAIADAAAKAIADAARAIAEAEARAAAKAIADAAAKAAAEKAAADAKIVSDAAAKAAAAKITVDKSAAEAAAKAAVEKAVAAAVAKSAADAAAAQAAVVAKAAADAQLAAVVAAEKAAAALKSATASAATKAAATKAAAKAAVTASKTVQAAATAAKVAATAKATAVNAAKQVDIAIGALGSKTAAAASAAAANAIAAAAKAAANQAAKAASDKAAAAKVASNNANKDAASAAARIATEQKEAADAAAAAKVATDLAQKATEEKIAAAAEAQKAAEAVVKALEEKIALADASVKAQDITERIAIDKKIDEITAKVTEAQRAADAANVKAAATVVAQEQAQTAATVSTQQAVFQATEAVAARTESVAKSAVATKAAAAASLAAKVATAAVAAAAKVPAKAVIAAKPSTPTKPNSAKATITGLKPGQKVKVTVNVKGN